MTEAEALAQAADQYRGDGYVVDPAPDRSTLPPELRRHHPFFVARRGVESAYVEAWIQGQLADLPPPILPAGWRYDAVILPRPNGTAEAPGPGPEATPDYAHRLLAEFDELLPRGATRARFLLAWSAAESAMRVAAARIGLDPAGVAAAQLMSELAFNGLIGPDEYARLRDYLFARNRLIHGVPAEGLDPRQADDLAGIARSLLAEAPVTAA